MLKDTFTIVAIDGGAAVGKSSVALGLAQRFDWLSVNTGLHYRLLTYCCLESSILPQENKILHDFLSSLDFQTLIVNRLDAVTGVQNQWIDAADLKSKRINQAVSQFAALPSLREKLVAYQRSLVTFAQQNGFKGLIMEGRDITSVVFPDATFAFFLQADEAIRAQRRLKQDGGSDNIASRDAIDSTRKANPLICPGHAHRIDTTFLTLDAVIAKISNIILSPDASMP